MNKIINNKRYDTATATKVASASNGGGWGDFDHWEETLYRKRTGEYFLHGEGGPMTRYAKSAGQNSWSGGEDLIPLSYESARAWAEEHLDGDAYEAIFGAVAEDDSRKYTTFSLPTGTVERLKREAARRGVGMSELLDELITSAI